MVSVWALCVLPEGSDSVSFAVLGVGQVSVLTRGEEELSGCKGVGGRLPRCLPFRHNQEVLQQSKLHILLFLLLSTTDIVFLPDLLHHGRLSERSPSHSRRLGCEASKITSYHLRSGSTSSGSPTVVFDAKILSLHVHLAPFGRYSDLIFSAARFGSAALRIHVTHACCRHSTDIWKIVLEC
jgi:hypothetical protein